MKEEQAEGQMIDDPCPAEIKSAVAPGQTRTLHIIHHNDLDGICAAAIVAKKNQIKD